MAAVPPDSAGQEVTVGQRIKFHRTRRGVSRAVLGGLVGKSEDWVKAVERGRLLPPRLPMLVRLAEVLRVSDLSELTGAQSMPLQMFTGPGHSALPAVRDAINSVPLTGDGPPPPLPHLRARLDAAWRARHAAPDHRTVLGNLLPDLIRDGQRAARMYEGAQRRQAQVVLAGVYNLAQFYVAYQPSADLLWRIAERALLVAQESEDPYAIGAAVWLLAQAHRDAGDLDAAETINREGLEMLRPRLDDAGDDLRAMWGALLFELAYTAARSGARGRAWGEWDRASKVAQSLPTAHYDLMTSFGRAIMAAHAVTLAVELHQGGESLRQANRASAISVPSHPRKGRHLIEVARAYQLGNDHHAALGSLRQAYTEAPETVRYNGYARRMVWEYMEKPSDLRRSASDLAGLIGLPA